MGKQRYFEPEFKKKIVRLYLEGRTVKSLNEEYQLGDGTVQKWVKTYREECENNPILKDEKESFKKLNDYAKN